MNPHPEPPPSLSLGFVSLLCIGVSLLTQIVTRLFAAESGLASTPLAFSMLTAFAIAFAIAAPRIPEPINRSLGLVSARPPFWLVAALLVPSLFLIDALDAGVRTIVPFAREALDRSEFFAGAGVLELMLVSVVVAPALEEVFFRGLVQPRLVERLGAVGGILLCAAFSALHAFSVLGARALATGFVEALLFGALRLRSGSIYPSLLLNAAFGLLIVLTSSGAVSLPGWNEPERAFPTWPWLLLGAAASAGGLAVLRTRPQA